MEIVSKEDGLIYLAGPYTSNTGFTRIKRFNQLTKVSAVLAENGVAVFSPITQSHEQSKIHQLPTSWSFWKDIDTIFLERCDTLVVVMLDGWKESVGVKAEIQIADSIGMPIRFVRYEDIVKS